mmetsp:Transcript_2549/g.3707  ORF Transcript_2549/g.3707 Transcript_2549/m.3707 type:complete len:325 (+) Transcript_2549:1103-2077(+)
MGAPPYTGQQSMGMKMLCSSCWWQMAILKPKTSPRRRPHCTGQQRTLQGRPLLRLLRRTLLSCLSFAGSGSGSGRRRGNRAAVRVRAASVPLTVTEGLCATTAASIPIIFGSARTLIQSTGMPSLPPFVSVGSGPCLTCSASSTRRRRGASVASAPASRLRQLPTVGPTWWMSFLLRIWRARLRSTRPKLMARPRGSTSLPLTARPRSALRTPRLSWFLVPSSLSLFPSGFFGVVEASWRRLPRVPCWCRAFGCLTCIWWMVLVATWFQLWLSACSTRSSSMSMISGCISCSRPGGALRSWLLWASMWRVICILFQLLIPLPFI